MDTSPEAEYRRLIHRLEEAKTQAERVRITDEISELRSNYRISSPEDDKKLKEVVNSISINPFTDKEWEGIINAVYEGYDTGFGDGHGTNAWNMKTSKPKRGLLDRLKGIFK
jgi:hypothetical protein